MWQGENYGATADASKKPMDELDVKSRLLRELNNSSGYISGQIARDRAKAMDFYFGKPLGTERPDRSQFVSLDVAETIEWILPALLKIFCSGDEVVEAIPAAPGYDAQADSITAALNYVFFQENNGFKVFHDWFKDALLQKVGIIKVYWDHDVTFKVEEYEGITSDQAALLYQDPTVEISQVEQNEDGTLNCIIKIKKDYSKVCIEGVPPEEFLINKDAKDVETARFTAHRTLKSASDLIEMGYPKEVIDTVPGTTEVQLNQEKLSRWYKTDEEYHLIEADGANRLIEICECYFRIDQDADGIAELRRIVIVGSDMGTARILENEIWPLSKPPFDTITPVPVPHRFFGLGLADLTMDLQDLKSTVFRQLLDNMYLSNNIDMVVNPAKTQLDTLATSLPGRIILADDPTAVTPISYPQLSNSAFGLIEYIDTIRENRTGITKYNQGLDAETLNKTASGINSIMNASQARIELIARIFAETGVKQLFKDIFELLCKYQKDPKVIRHNEQFLRINPREWDERTDVTLSVGLGTGTHDTKVKNLQIIMQIQQQIAAAGGLGVLVKPENIYNAAAKMTEQLGFKTPQVFFNDPTQDPQAQQVLAQKQQQNPQAMQQQLMQAQAQREQQKAQIDLQKHQADMAASAMQTRQDTAEKQQKLVYEHQRNLMELQKKAMELQFEKERAKAKIAAETMKNAIKLKAEHDKAQINKQNNNKPVNE